LIPGLPGGSEKCGNVVLPVDGPFFAGVVLLALLALELSDRVTMKRDLEIAREIQSWLMPSETPKAPGVGQSVFLPISPGVLRLLG